MWILTPYERSSLLKGHISGALSCYLTMRVPLYTYMELIEWKTFEQIFIFINIFTYNFFRGSPSVQANSLLALAALAVHSSRHSDSLDQDALKALRETPEHLSQAHWLNIVTDTFMAILDVTFEPQGKILAVCQQVIFCFGYFMLSHLHNLFHTAFEQFGNSCISKRRVSGSDEVSTFCL